MILLSRILVGLIGVLSLVSVHQHWFRMDSLMAERGFQAIGDIGRANIRADIGGLFLAISIFALIAAARQNRMWLSATIILTGGALLGRFVSIAIDGYSPCIGSPMIIEAVVLVIYGFAYWAWGEKPEGL
jgi:hypothetical protein